jgi:hypothetical protein
MKTSDHVRVPFALSSEPGQNCFIETTYCFLFASQAISEKQKRPTYTDMGSNCDSVKFLNLQVRARRWPMPSLLYDIQLFWLRESYVVIHEWNTDLTS